MIWELQLVVDVVVVVDAPAGRRIAKPSTFGWPMNPTSVGAGVTSTQFDLAALGVVRRGYNYGKDLAALGFFIGIVEAAVS